MSSLKGKDILDGAQFSRDEIETIMALADNYRGQLHERRGLDILRGAVLAALFFEPSTRTRLSFETAMHRLGGSVVGFSSAESTSVAKGETLSDTIRTVDQYVDVIAMRHPRIGSAREAADVANAPVLNGGDGAGQHPTQALLDLYTIRQERGKVEGNTIVLVGDLKNGRTVHAGVEIYKHYDCKLICVAPEALRMPAEVVERLRGARVRRRGNRQPGGRAAQGGRGLHDAHPEGTLCRSGRVRAAEGCLHPEPGDGRTPAPRRDGPAPAAAHQRDRDRRRRPAKRRLFPPGAATASSSAWRCWRSCWAQRKLTTKTQRHKVFVVVVSLCLCG